MQEEIQAEEELSLSEIFRALKAKIWVLLVTLIIGIAAGGGFGFLRYYNVHYYGGELTYFISSAGKESGNSASAEGQITQSYNENVLNMITTLLNSKVFNRVIMDGLPEAEGIEQETKEEEEFFLRLSESISYKYTVGKNTISVSVSALNDQTFASELMDRIKTVLPSYVTQNMNEQVFGPTSCSLINWTLCRLLNPNQWVTEGIKYGALIGLAALVVACVAVVIAERADTRLHDYEKVAQKFNVPVLGVIPRISDIEHTHIQRNKTEGKK